MLAELEPELIAGCHELGIPLSAAQARGQVRLLAELLEWNGRFNLTSITAPADMLRKHLLDSLVVLPYLRGARIADIGTGAGFPGLPLAICSPERQFTLLDATAKKCRFVAHAAAMLGLSNVTVVHARAEAWRPAAAFDTVVARALTSLAEFIRCAAHLCASGGRMLAMKGRVPEAELASLPRGWRMAALHRLTVPGLEAQRHLVELVRNADAPRGPS